jgi:hypothetical protein
MSVADNAAPQLTSAVPPLADGVPPWLIGMWERRYIRRADAPFAPDDVDTLGPEESGIIVRYLQTERAFIDIRVPAARPVSHFSNGGLQTAPAEQLQRLFSVNVGVDGGGDDNVNSDGGDRRAEASAFAGVTEVWRRDDGEERVHWHAAFNFSPPADAARLWRHIDSGRHTTEDIGRVDHKEHGRRWFEWGVADDTFVEEWVKLPDTVSVEEQQLDRFEFALRRPGGMFIVVGDWFAFVNDERLSTNASVEADNGLVHRLRSDVVSIEEKRLYVDAEYSCGTVSGGWRVTLSTLPWRQGEQLPIADLFSGGGDELGGWQRLSGERVTVQQLIARGAKVD